MLLTLSDNHRLFVDVDGAALRISRTGLDERPTVIALHGGPGFDHMPMKASLDWLPQDYQTVWYDHRGMGRSICEDKSKWNLQQWAKDLFELIEILGLKKPIILGQSFGGFVAMQFALDYPGVAGGLVLSSTAAGWYQQEQLDGFEKLGGSKAREVAQRCFEDPCMDTWNEYARVCLPLYTKGANHPGNSSVPQILKLEVLFHSWRWERNHYNLLPRLHEIQIPAWVVCGAEDPITPLICSQDIAKRLAGKTRFDIVPDAGHGVYRDQPEWYRRTLQKWIANLVAS